MGPFRDTTDVRYTALLDPDPAGAGYTVTVPALPGRITEGPTIDEALASAREAIACHIEGMLVSGDGVLREAPPLISLVVDVEVGQPSAALTG